MRPRAGADWQRFRTGVAAGDASTGLDAVDARDRGAPAVAGRLDALVVDRDSIAPALAGRRFLCGSVNSALYDVDGG